uniref:Indican synthase 2 n=1 Tax=Persicaria tinctoria TaxID=96455 RepID=A0A2Z5UHQ8_9CARY|nr:hypothetical protein [Persicaria tinctoria]BDH72952.1 indican synthase 2 [Persicaria tinctoria]
MKKAHLVFIPSPGVGHLVSAVEFSRRLLARDARLSITILAMTSPFPTSTSLPQTTSTPSTDSNSPGEPHYIFLPQADLPPKEVLENSMEEYISKFAASHSHHVRTALLTLQESSLDRVRFHLVVDMFCTSLIDVGKDLGIPSYLFLTSGAAFLSLLLHLPERFLRTGVPRFDESEPEIAISGFQNPVPSSALPEFAFNTSGYTALMSHANKLEETNGLIINTFAELEPFAIKSLREVYDELAAGTESEIKIQRFRPPLFTVGPVLDLKGQARRPGDASQESKIMKWLDTQPEASVVFLCFGSVGAFSEEQAKEIANGLTQSGQRFLWSLRKKTTTGAKRPMEYTDAELKGVLPKEFWGAVEGGRGLVCGWAPQAEILAHKAIGSFVSHCGWNSTLESVWFGKPIVAWPLYAEQPSNAFELVNELGLAAAWLGYGGKPGDLVTADEVERAVRSVMDSDNPVRSRAKEMSEASKSALLNGGSSFDSIGCLMRKIIGDEL